MADAGAAAVFGGLPAEVRRLLADPEKARRRRVGMVKAAWLGVSDEALVAFAVARNGGDLADARRLATWAVRAAARPRLDRAGQ